MLQKFSLYLLRPRANTAQTCEKIGLNVCEMGDDAKCDPDCTDQPENWACNEPDDYFPLATPNTELEFRCVP